jgi:RNA-directed DNA polymerase
MARQFPHLPFERYADDAIVHCRTRREAEEVRNAVAQRLQECRLELHPEKTKIVYCKDEDRRGNYPNEKFDFLGYTFRPRKSKTRWGKLSRMFNPIIRGWLHYYGRFYRSAVYLSLLQMDNALARWASQKFKRLRRRQRRAHQWVARLSRRDPALFAHWQMVKGGSVVGAV